MSDTGARMNDVFIVFGRDSCPYCKKAVELVKEKGYPVAYMDLNEYPNLKDPSWKTIPQIFFRGKHVGGFKNLKTYFEVIEDAS